MNTNATTNKVVSVVEDVRFRIGGQAKERERWGEIKQGLQGLSLRYAAPHGQLARPKAGMTECDRGYLEQGLWESRHNNADGRG